MDPDANLNEQLELAKGIIADADLGLLSDPDEAFRLAELVLALDGWLCHKNFLPERWR